MPAFNFQDSKNILSKLSLRRLWNAAKVFSSFYLSNILKRPIIWGLPYSISFEPTTSCNLRCPECPSGLRAFTRPTGMLNSDFFTKTIDEIHKDLIYLIFYFQGEPYLNPNFLEMVKYANSKNIYTATSTNAHFLNDAAAKKTIESGLDRLIISIDGTTQETYSKYRVGGSLQKVLSGTANIVKWKKELKSKTPFIIFQFLVVKHNQHQIDEIKKIGKELGVDEVRFKTAQVYDYENDPNNLIPDIEKYSRYKKNKNGINVAKNKNANHCWKFSHSNVITFDGAVVPCCFDKDASHKLGDLKKESFKQIWKNNNYQKFRHDIMKSRKNIDICANCSEGISVWK